jgi:DNA polymerase III epsilon subunit-like protein
MKSFVILDIETLHAVQWPAIRARRGFKPPSDAAWNDVLPAQVCAVRFDGGEESGRLSTTVHWSDRDPLDNPYCPRLTAEAVENGVSPSTLFEMLATLASGVDAFVGYNVDFDMGCLRHHAASHGRPLPCVPDVCLMAPAAARMGQRRWPKLVDAYRALVGPPDEALAHDAEYDVFMTCELMKVLTESEPDVRPASASPPE